MSAFPLVSVSGMMYRMKRNAVGLANICILATMVLVMISATASLVAGAEQAVRLRYPYDLANDGTDEYTAAVSFALFAAAYAMVYGLTARTYYRIVSPNGPVNVLTA